MFKANFKIAWRNLLKDKQFTFLNLLGLSTGLACTLLIFLWVSDELSFDKIFANDDRLYKLMEFYDDNGDISMSEESSGMLSETAKQQVAGIEYAAAVAPPGWFPQYTLTVDEKNIKANGQYVGKDYFNIFSFKLIEGNKNTVLDDIHSIVISDELAKKLFGTTENILKKPVRFERDSTFFVSGVFEKTPQHSSQQFDYVMSFEYFKTIKNWVTKWDNLGPHNYVLLTKGTNLNTFNRNIENIVSKNGGDTTRKVLAKKFSEVYLHNNYGNNAKSAGRFEYVRLFSILALFVLVIACINFTNLSTAKGAKRLKEIGIKKVVGANRSQLIVQFLSESILLTLFASVLAVVVAAMLLPVFNHITGKQIVIHFDSTIVLYSIISIVCTGVLAGSYPALYLSKFNPLAVFKGKLNTSIIEVLSRKGLVVFQFALSTILIVAVIIIYQQIQFIQNTDIGYNKNNILRLSAEGNIKGKEDAFIAELKNIPGINNASSTFHNMVGHNYGDYGIVWPGKDPNQGVFFEGFGVNYGFIETMGIKLLQGRSFSRNFGADSAKIIFNETAVKTMHLKDPIGKTIQRFGNNFQIIGVVNDFHYESMHETIKPSYIFLQQGSTIVASVRADHQQQTIAAIQRLYERYNPGFPFTFNFLDEAYQKQYDSEVRVSVLSKYFAGLAILISCLGLFGLAAFTAQKRRREIGVRKVIGASVMNITTMLSMEFLQLILIALLIALPVSWWLMNSWLQSFAYRVHITAYVFIMAGLSVMLITLFTISFQAIKAATANPVKSLRTE